MSETAEQKTGGTQRFCRKCLIREMMERGDQFQNMYDYIARMDPEIKCDAKEYERRLAFCKECDNLLTGMCRICGCYVEMRAAVRQNYCPASPKKW